MHTLYIKLIQTTDESAELRYLINKGTQYEQQILDLSNIEDLIQQAKQDYYMPLPDLKRIGQRLFFWLDGQGRWLSRAIDNCLGEGLVVAIEPHERLSHLPWEVMHDDNDFLVKRVNPVVVPVRWVDRPREEHPPQIRPLQVLFMATAPEGVTPALEYEREEAEILNETKDFPLVLRVEESGCVTELGKLWSRYIETFDVIHMTGHASIQKKSPCHPYFITETEMGDAHPTTASEIAEALRFRFPPLVFLSGCRTGEAANDGAVPSLSEALITQGAIAVLGWGRPIGDTAATATAAHLYGQLAAGYSLSEALASTYKYLLKENIKGWHLLRLYIRGECLGALVESLGDLVWEPIESSYEQFLDSKTQTVRVATPQEFVGRRRELQRCLRALRTSNTLGVLVCGLGGIGKSTVAARLLERLIGYEQIFIYRGFDEDKLLRLLAEQCTSETGLEILQGKLPLMQRLTKFLKEGLNQPEQRFVFVLDDFEANLELRADGLQVLKAGVVEALMSLLRAIVKSRLPHRVVITCRYDLVLPEENHRLYREPLTTLKGVDLRKKYDRLMSFSGKVDVDSGLKERAKQLADGNPRLLEWLDKILQVEDLDHDAVLQKMAKVEQKFREDVVAEALVNQQPIHLKQLLSLASVFRLPVPRIAINNLCSETFNSGLDNYLRRASTLGLIEITSSQLEPLYRVPRILEPLLEPVLSEENLHQRAAQILYALWWQNAENLTEEQQLEIHRLALSGKEKTICVEVAYFIANKWYVRRRVREAAEICKHTLEIASDYRLLHALARAERKLGNDAEAARYYQQALDSYSSEDEKFRKFILAGLKASLGEVEEAIKLYEESGVFQERDALIEKMRQDELGRSSQTYYVSLNHMAYTALNVANMSQIATNIVQGSTNVVTGYQTSVNMPPGIAFKLLQTNLEFFERTGDTQGEAATLYEMACLKTKQGEIQEATELFLKSLEIDERTNNAQGKASTLSMLGQLLSEGGDTSEALNHLKKALVIFEQLKSPETDAVRDLIASLVYK